MSNQIDHIGIAVKNLERSIDKWRKNFDLHLQGIEEIEERKVRLANLETKGGTCVELLSSLEKNSVIQKFIQKKGEGIHHICFKVKDIEKTIQEFKKVGIEFVQDKPQKGAQGSRIAFIHPQNFNGVLVELKEKK